MFDTSKPFRVDGLDYVLMLDGDKLFHLHSQEALFLNGFQWDDVQVIESHEMPAGEMIGTNGLIPSRFFRMRNVTRSSAANPHLKAGMLGYEVGAGPFPHPLPKGVDCHYYDKRDEDELKDYFHTSDSVKNRTMDELEKSRQYDFLVAHHTLEHTIDPVGTLIDWHESLSGNAVVCISVPDASRTHDRDRMVTPLSHMLLDYAIGTEIGDYENRIHVPEFVMSWRNDDHFGPLSKEDMALRSKSSTSDRGGDCHWHAWDINTLKDVVEAAAYFGGRSAEFVSVFSASQDEAAGHLNDALVVYLLKDGSHTFTSPGVEAAVAGIQKKLLLAVERVSKTRLSSAG